MRSNALKIPYPAFPNIPPDSMFVDAHLKLYWARKHAHEVSFCWEEAVKRHYTAATGAEIDLPYSLDHFLVHPPVPINVPLGVGDCIRNLRTSLDYLVSAMARAAGLSDRQTIFPFDTERSGLKSRFKKSTPKDKHQEGRRAGALHDLGRKYPNLEKVILNKIKPWSVDHGADARGDILWRLITSDYIEKHRLMTPAVQRSEPVVIKTTQHIEWHGSILHGNPLRFEPGTRLQKDSDFAVGLVFPEPARLAAKPVTSTLIEGCTAVGEVIEIFEQEFQAPQTPIKS